MTRGDAAGFRVLCLGFLGCTTAPVESVDKVVYRGDGDFQAAFVVTEHGSRRLMRVTIIAHPSGLD